MKCNKEIFTVADLFGCVTFSVVQELLVITVYVCITVIDYCDWLYVVLYQHAIKQENIARFLITKTQVS